MRRFECAASPSRQGDAAFPFDARAPEQQNDVTDSLDQRRLLLPAYAFAEFLSLAAVVGYQFDLDQFVVIQCLVDFRHDRVGEAGSAHENHRFQCVAEAAQVTFLIFSEAFHGAEIRLAR